MESLIKIFEIIIEGWKKDLADRARNLEDVQGAIRMLLSERQGNTVRAIKESVLHNVNGLIMPYVEQLMTSNLDKRQLACMEVIEKNLRQIISPCYAQLNGKSFNMTSRETQIVNLIVEGKSSKEISHLLNLSISAIDFHRNKIRTKLGIKGRKINLRTHILSLPEYQNELMIIS